MSIKKTEKIWHNGKLIRWDDAQIHVLSHVSAMDRPSSRASAVMKPSRVQRRSG